MLNTISVNSLCAIKLEPVFVRQLSAIVARAAVRIPHLRHRCVSAHESFVIIGKTILHELISKRSLSGSHHAKLKCEILER